MYRHLGAMVNVYAADGSGRVVGQTDAPAGVTAVHEGGGAYADAAGVWHEVAPGSAPGVPGSGGGEGGDVQCADDHDNCHRIVRREGNCDGPLIEILSAVGPGCDAPAGGGGGGGGMTSLVSSSTIAGLPSWAIYVGLAGLAYFLLRR